MEPMTERLQRVDPLLRAPMETYGEELLSLSQDLRLYPPECSALLEKMIGGSGWNALRITPDERTLAVKMFDVACSHPLATCAYFWMVEAIIGDPENKGCDLDTRPLLPPRSELVRKHGCNILGIPDLSILADNPEAMRLLATYVQAHLTPRWRPLIETALAALRCIRDDHPSKAAFDAYVEEWNKRIRAL